MILINYGLPNSRYQDRQVNGTKIIRILKANSNISPSLPIVGFSWVADTANEFLESGADGFYHKRELFKWRELFKSRDYQKFVNYLQEIFHSFRFFSVQHLQSTDEEKLLSKILSLFNISPKLLQIVLT